MDCMDIQKLVADVLEKLQGNDGLIAKFNADPVKTLEGLLNIDLPDDQVNAIIKAVKAKLNLDNVAKGAEGVLGAVKGLFGK